MFPSAPACAPPHSVCSALEPRRLFAEEADEAEPVPLADDDSCGAWAGAVLVDLAASSAAGSSARAAVAALAALTMAPCRPASLAVP